MGEENYLLARITTVALDCLGIFVKLAILVGTDWVKTQVVV